MAFDLTLKTTVLCVRPPGRLGVSPGDLSCFLIGQTGTPVVSAVALATGGISELVLPGLFPPLHPTLQDQQPRGLWVIKQGEAGNVRGRMGQRGGQCVRVPEAPVLNSTASSQRTRSMYVFQRHVCSSSTQAFYRGLADGHISTAYTVSRVPFLITSEKSSRADTDSSNTAHSSPDPAALLAAASRGMEKIIRRNVWGALKQNAPRNRPMGERGRVAG
ncbi:hypothetical protein E1301_Tti019888 [Triplophysa tibetana]|uniref:Uncharacterized protein n=1 Tax=Triplophysa tibetana TaxID=1572043 RepID=A0A5A9PCJ8_9TELE|nr:hypothetical protein E1301_Tti023585 [Triplophysa tibetana]KAA0719949.1 hypothetical protein E1301_Tti019888 [Triplophysa tibetana]